MYTITHRSMSTSGDGDHERIASVYVLETSSWWTVEQVIDAIDNRGQKFVVKQGGKTAEVGVRRDPGKRPYIQTHADGYWNNNLLALPEV
jgi:hypothetical protein